jgi:hypothetical protein
MNDYVERVLRAYFRAGNTIQPANYSDIHQHNGRDYVRLENVNGILAVYWVTNAGKLKRLERWPKALDLA